MYNNKQSVADNPFIWFRYFDMYLPHVNDAIKLALSKSFWRYQIGETKNVN